jgi:hypothetical protein
LRERSAAGSTELSVVLLEESEVKSLPNKKFSPRGRFQAERHPEKHTRAAI